MLNNVIDNASSPLTGKERIAIGDLVQLNNHYKNRDRLALVISSKASSSFCEIMFMDTGQVCEAIKSGLVVYGKL
jgi:hypothetical protein